MTWHLEVDAHTCIGSGMCAALAPEWFELTGETATARAAEVDEDEILLDAADSCPAMAIAVANAAGEEIGPRP
ncbi:MULTISPECIES: ferredoxin [Amycolatopsis]|nr:ferredoxin [Amycolatopsis xylanica]